MLKLLKAEEKRLLKLFKKRMKKKVKIYQIVIIIINITKLNIYSFIFL